MFLGTTPRVIAQYIQKIITEVKPKRVFVPFAGNFVIEQIAALVNPDIEVFSSDVSLYSVAIGNGLTNMPLDIRLNDDVLEDFPFFRDKKNPLEIAAMVMFFSEVAQYRAKQNIPYYKALYEDSIKHVEKYYGQILDKLNKFIRPKRHYFLGDDAVKLLDMTKENDFVYYDPPIYKNGYEKMFENLNECFTWEAPVYTDMNDEVKQKQLKELDKKNCKVYYLAYEILNWDLPNYQNVIRYEYNYDKFHCIYTNNHDDKKYVGRFTALREQIKNYKLISKADQITRNSSVKVVKVNTLIGNHYRLMWVHKARQKNMGTPFLIFVDEKLIGMVELGSGLQFSTDLALIVTDPCPDTSNYKRLSKLVLYIVSTQEMLKAYNDITMWEHTGFTTRVFTQHPVSMKYRNLFDLIKREEAKDGNYKYALVYQNRTKILPTFKDGLNAWLKKDGQVLENEWTSEPKVKRTDSPDGVYV